MKETIADFRVEKDSKGRSGKCLLRSTVFAGSREFSYNRIKYASGNY